jgi:hypothetical protein
MARRSGLLTDRRAALLNKFELSPAADPPGSWPVFPQDLKRVASPRAFVGSFPAACGPIVSALSVGSVLLDILIDFGAHQQKPSGLVHEEQQ